MKLKKSNKNKRGGEYNDQQYLPPSFKLLGSGSFGCVIQPALMKNTTDNYVDNNYVGKLFKSKDEFDDELRQLDIIKRYNIDPNNTFTVKLITQNEININDIYNIQDVYKCILDNHAENNNRSVYQIVLENGGKSLHSLNTLNTSITFEKLIQILEPFLLGVQRMHSVGFVHLDIKPLNILFNGDKLSLIDFGLSTTSDNVFNENNKYILKSSNQYYYYPDDFLIANHMLQYRYKKGEDFLNEMNTYINFDNAFNQALLSKHGEMNMHIVKNALNEYIRDIKEKFKNNLDGITFENIFDRTMALKSDIYSLTSLFSKLNDITTYDNFDKQKRERQENFVKEMFSYCKEHNPLKRKSINEIVSIFKLRVSQL